MESAGVVQTAMALILMTAVLMLTVLQVSSSVLCLSVSLHIFQQSQEHVKVLASRNVAVMTLLVLEIVMSTTEILKMAAAHAMSPAT